ncbi:MAG: PA14 domain-containing protein, partial [Melioribacteraceae bacterium]
AVSGISQAAFTKVFPRKSDDPGILTPGFKYFYFEGDWDKLPDFSGLNAKKVGSTSNYNLSPRNENEHFGFEFIGYVKVPKDDVYVFYTDSDDGSNLYIGNKLVVDNDGLHGIAQKKGLIPLSSGFHPIRISYFNKTGGLELKVFIEGGGMKKQALPEELLFHLK